MSVLSTFKTEIRSKCHKYSYMYFVGASLVAWNSLPDDHHVGRT